MNLHRTEPGLTVGNCLISTVPLLATVVFALTVDRLSADVALSFVVLGLAMSLHCLQAIRGRANSAADASVFVFGLMFLLVAPIVQLSVLGYKLVNTTYAQADLLVETNLACSLFIGVYLLARITVLKPPPPTDFVRDLAPPTAGISAFSMTAFIGISVFIALFSLPFIGAGVADQSLTPVLLGFRKFLFFVPTALFLIVLADYTSTARKHSFLQLLLLVLMFLCVLATQNPATEKRNGLGPVYLAMIFLMFRGRFQRKGVQVGWLTGVLLVLFPLTAVLTVIPWKYLDEVDLKWSLFTDHFLVTHYDAWANVYTAIEMVGRNGLSAGKQLGGALLFYVPSTWWSGKPLATGIEIGNYLITYHQMWFTNLSAPLIAEGFLDFGYFGVVGYAIGLAALVRGIEHWSSPGRTALIQAMAAYLAFFIVFLLRGSMMIAFAYGSGAIAAFVLSRGLIALFSRGAVPRQPGQRRLGSTQAAA